MSGFNLLVLSISFCVFQSAVSAQSHQEGGSLKCVSDFKSTLSCAWNTTGKLRESSCRLHFTWTVNRRQRKIQRYETCELQDSPSDPRMQSCSVIAGGNQEWQTFSSVTVITSRVKCGNSSQDAANITFKPSENVKMHPPFAPSIVNSTNITWTLNQNLISVYLQQREFEIRFKCKGKSWEDARVISELQGQEWIRLNEKWLDRDAVYETQVRVKSRDHAGEWSEWSPVTEWRSEVGNMAEGGSLKCVSDFKSTLSCAWNTTGNLRESSCRLHFTWTVNRRQRKIQRYETCELQDSPSDPRMQSCSVIAGGNQEWQTFSSVTVITSRVKCGNCSQDAANITFKPSENVKMHPPFAPSIVDSTDITWTLNQNLIPVYLQQREFQIRFKRKEKSWENARVISEFRGQEWTRLNEKWLDRDAVYETQVRVKSREHAGEWSEWSPVTEWRSQVGN